MLVYFKYPLKQKCLFSLYHRIENARDNLAHIPGFMLAYWYGVV